MTHPIKNKSNTAPLILRYPTTWTPYAFSIMVAAPIVATIGMIFLGRHWSINESRRKGAQAWMYLGWDDAALSKQHRHFAELIANGDRKAENFRSLEAIEKAIEMRARLGSKPQRTYLHMYTYIEIEPNGEFYDVFYVVDDSELAVGRRSHVGELRPFAGSWQLRPAPRSESTWTLDENALSELLDKVSELNGAHSHGR